MQHQPLLSLNIQSVQMPTNNGSNGNNGNNGRFLMIKDLEPNQKSISLYVIVIEVAKPTQTKDGHEIRTVRIADKSGSINLSVWNDHGAVLREGDILKLNGCFTQIWKNSLQVKIGNKGQIIKCGEFMMIFNETPDMSVLSPEALKSIQEQQSTTKQSNPSSANNNSKQIVNFCVWIGLNFDIFLKQIYELNEIKIKYFNHRHIFIIITS